METRLQLPGALLPRECQVDRNACENDRGVPGTGQIHWDEVAEALEDIKYDGPVVIESFTSQVKEIARAVCIWRPIAPSQDAIASQGLNFLKALLA